MLVCVAISVFRPYVLLGFPFLLLFVVGYLPVGLPSLRQAWARRSQVAAQDGLFKSNAARPDPTVVDPGPGGDGDQPVLPTCTIEVCCKLIVFDQAWHCFTKCTKIDEDGDVTVQVCRGGPTRFTIFPIWPKVKDENGNPRNFPPDCFGDPIWGPIDIYCGPYRRGHPDYPGDPEDLEAISCNVIVSDSQACLECQCLEVVMQCIEECCIPYDPLFGPNSNSAAYTALATCLPLLEVVVFLPPGAPLLDTPGWGELIDISACCP